MHSSYWIVKYYKSLGWTALASTKSECAKIMFDSSNESVFACMAKNFFDEEEMIILDVFNPEDFRPFEINNIYVDDQCPYKIYVRNYDLIDSRIWSPTTLAEPYYSTCLLEE